LLDGGVLQANLALTSNADGTQNRLAAAWSANDIAAVANGGTVQTDASATLPTPTVLCIGYGTGGANITTSRIAKILYLPRRMSNAELIVLTGGSVATNAGEPIGLLLSLTKSA
jgi:hypothetical protein